MNRLTLIKAEYNNWNGFGFEILGIEYQGKTKGFEHSLFGLWFSKDYLIIDIFFITFEIR